MKDFLTGLAIIILLSLFIIACGGVENSVTYGEMYSNVLMGIVAIVGVLVLEIIGGVL